MKSPRGQETSRSYVRGNKGQKEGKLKHGTKRSKGTRDLDMGF